MRNNGQVKIFIVEDNKIFAKALKIDIETAFTNIPVNINLFETGEVCMEKFKEVKPHVVILDYHLNSKFPDAVDGIKVLDWIKKENKDTYVIMLTGDDNIDIALNSFKHGASDYIVKTDTKFKKIIFSLFNFIKIMKTKKVARIYLVILIVTALSISLLVGGVIAMQIIAPFFN